MPEIFNAIHQKITSCMSPNRTSTLREPSRFRSAQLNEQLESLNNCDLSNTQYQASMLMDRYASQKQTQEKYFTVDRDAILSRKLNRPQQKWLQGQRQLSTRLQGPDKFDWHVKRLPGEARYRLYIDRDRQHLGRLCFDRLEPGYAAAMESALETVRETIGQRLDADLYQTLHDKAANNVIRLNRKGTTIPQGLGEGDSVYGLRMQQVTPEAKQEWLRERLIWENERNSGQCTTHFLSVLENGQLVAPNIEHGEPKEILKTRLNEILSTYYRSMRSMHSELGKKRVIARTCRALEISHFFNDANQRTVVFLVLNKLLIDEGLTPTIVADPYVFDGYMSADQLVSEINQGQAFFQQLCDTPSVDSNEAK